MTSTNPSVLASTAAPGSPPRPVVVVSGPDPGLRARVARDWVAGRSAAERWVRVLSGPGAGLLATAGGAAAAPAGHALIDASLGVICPCCLAGPVLGTALGRIIARHRPDGLVIDVAAAGHAEPLIDRLRSAPLADALLPGPFIHALPGWPGPIPAHASEVRIELAGGALDGSILPERLDAGCPELAGGPAQPGLPWPFVSVAGPNARGRGSVPGPGPGSRARYLPDPMSGRADVLVHAWPADRIADRREADGALHALAGHPAVAGVVALLRTPRAWYRWSDGVLAETGWRADNRIMLRLAGGNGLFPAADRSSVAERLMALETCIGAAT